MNKIAETNDKLTVKEIFNKIYTPVCDEYILWLKQIGLCPFNLDEEVKNLTIDTTKQCFVITSKNNIKIFMVSLQNKIWNVSV